MELVFINSSKYIISGYLDEIPTDHNKVSGDIKPEKKRNYSDMEISEEDGEDIELYANRESDVWSDSGEHEGFDRDEPDLKETLTRVGEGYPDSIVDGLYNQLEVEKDCYESESIVDH